MTHQNVCRLGAVLILASLAASWRGYSMIGQITARGGQAGFGLIMLAMLVLGLACVVGLWLCREWGFFALYGYVVLATVMLGMSIIPYVPRLFSDDLRVWSVVGLNALVLAAGGALHWRHRRDRALT